MRFAALCLSWCALAAQYDNGASAVRAQESSWSGMPLLPRLARAATRARLRPFIRLGLQGGSSDFGDDDGQGINDAMHPRRDGEEILDEIEGLLRRGDLVSVCVCVVCVCVNFVLGARAVALRQGAFDHRQALDKHGLTSCRRVCILRHCRACACRRGTIDGQCNVIVHPNHWTLKPEA